MECNFNFFIVYKKNSFLLFFLFTYQLFLLYCFGYSYQSPASFFQRPYDKDCRRDIFQILIPHEDVGALHPSPFDRSIASHVRRFQHGAEASLQLIVAPTGSAQNVDCRTFDAQPGLCPFGGLCQCTLGASCSAGAEYGPPSYPFSRSLRRADGACAGECLQVVPGQCPGPASCLASSGPCIPPAPCVPPTRNGPGLPSRAAATSASASRNR